MMNPEIEDKIRLLGRLAVAQLEALDRIHPENPAQIRQFEENSALAVTLIGDLAAALALDGSDPYAFFCQVTALATAQGSEAGQELALCLPKMAALRGRN